MLIKILTVLIFFLLIMFAVVATVFLFPIHKLNPAAAEGENLLESETPQYALARFLRAEAELPILKYNLYFNGLRNKAVIEIQKYKVRNPALILFVSEDYDAGLLVDFVGKLKSTEGVIEARFVPSEDSAKSYIQMTRRKGLLNIDDTYLQSSTIEIYLTDWDKTSQLESLSQDQEFVVDIMKNKLP